MVQLGLVKWPNGRHRADLQKLIVHTRARRAARARADGGGRAVALEHGRTLLVLDTAGGGAEELYRASGWVEIGAVPRYAGLPPTARSSRRRSFARRTAATVSRTRRRRTRRHGHVRGTGAESVVELHVVSDATGETATRVVAATEAQFPDQPFATVRHPRVETVADLQLALARMEGHRRAVVIFTIVEPTLRSAMRELCEEAAVDYCDLLAEPLEAVAKVSGTKAELRPGARPPLDESYFKRIAAIEFAVKNDDGLGRALDDADVVLVGVSRTSKTPLSIYLGYLGWKATNVPLVKGIEPPPELFQVDPTRIVGLTIDAHRLAEIRTRARRADGRRPPLRRPERDLRGPRARRRDPAPARLPGDRRLRALDRGDRAPDHPHRRAPHRHRPGRHMKPKPPVSKARWALWCFLLGVAMFTFYVLFTPFWFALRSLAWLAEYRARRRR